LADIRIDVGVLEFTARWEANAPVSRAWLLNRLPLEGTLLQARWSGEAGWSRLGANLRLEPENATTRPGPGQILLYAGDVSEPELLIPYGACAFAYQGGPLRGNHVVTLDQAPHELRTLGEILQSKGAQSLRITSC
jgi:hypothetical protein